MGKIEDVGRAIIMLVLTAIIINYLLSKFPGATELLNLDLIVAVLLIAAPGAGILLHYLNDDGF